ncbi:NAD(+) diphosphatase [Schaalia sp. 19OD2882]|uniref:NAD(+) diphosphatase n=1 Tax=Schaalia sp. 19OD2882 TaxID=2794089 RepID=UPI001C1EE41F|nr:NAD(+) diphosphatase [Schaalia sp. 19OD2882]QWW20184.1 NAD(+) diphosphatase [Schaalia sp. 19OD2882]
MDARLPLARGLIDPMVSFRQTLGETDLVVEGSIAGVRRIEYLVVGDRGAVLLASQPANGRQVGLLRGGAQLREMVAGRTSHVLALGVTAEGTFHVALHVPRTCASAGPGRCEARVEGAGVEEFGGVWSDLRRVGHLLGDEDAALATSACALVAWHGEVSFCQSCGAPSHVSGGGWTRTCSACGRLEYPRQDPAVIALVTDEDDRVLLAHNTAWRPRFMSLPAGFVDAGESPERTVVRELREEVGLEVTGVDYLASQPWPFPRSMMMAFRAHLAPGSARTPTPDGVEIDRACFLSRSELVEAVTAGDIEPPRPTAIARVVLEDWLGGPLPPWPAHAQDPAT